MRNINEITKRIKELKEENNPSNDKLIKQLEWILENEEISLQELRENGVNIEFG